MFSKLHEKKRTALACIYIYIYIYIEKWEILMEKSTARTCTKGIHSMYGILTSDMRACFDYSLNFSDTINLKGPSSTDHSFFSLIIV